jgi:hypothetical protein
MVRLSPAPGKSAAADVLAAARRRLLQPSACLLRARTRAEHLTGHQPRNLRLASAPATKIRYWLLVTHSLLTRFSDVAQVFDYRAGRLDDAADGPAQGKPDLTAIR